MRVSVTVELGNSDYIKSTFLRSIAIYGQGTVVEACAELKHLTSDLPANTLVKTFMPDSKQWNDLTCVVVENWNKEYSNKWVHIRRLRGKNIYSFLRCQLLPYEPNEKELIYYLTHILEK